MTNFEPPSNMPIISDTETPNFTLMSNQEQGEFTDKETAILAEVARSNHGAIYDDIQMIKSFFRASRRPTN